MAEEVGNTVRCVVQRVTEGSVDVGGVTVGAIGEGLVVLVGIEETDTDADIVAGATKVAGLRVFRDEEGKMNRSVVDVGGSVLVVSQFTLAGDTRKGRRPSFTSAAPPHQAEPMVARFCEIVKAEGIEVEQGVFGADMTVRIVNDGPVTLIIETIGGAVTSRAAG